MKPKKDIKYELVKEIETRWSGRAFDQKEIPQISLEQIFEAARWAPSSYNAQPWNFIVGRKGTETFSKIQSTLLPGNEPWAKNAGALILTFVKTVVGRENKPNKYAWHDTGASVAFLTLQAEKLNLNVHQMGGFNPSKAEEIFNLEENHEFVSAIAIGFRGDADVLDENLKKREESKQTRKDIKEFVHFGD